MEKLKMRCTIFQNYLIWLRLASTHGSVDKFNIIKCFIKKSIGAYHRQLTIRFWLFELYVGTNPFQNQTIISLGRRTFDYYFIQCKYEKSKWKIDYGKDSNKNTR